MLCADIPGKFLLEGGNLGAHDVLAMIEYSLNPLIDLFLGSISAGTQGQ